MNREEAEARLETKRDRLYAQLSKAFADSAVHQYGSAAMPPFSQDQCFEWVFSWLTGVHEESGLPGDLTSVEQVARAIAARLNGDLAAAQARRARN
jgi:hypothetical protein